MSSNKMIMALHGFLGAPSDWQKIEKSFSDYSWSPIDLFHDDCFDFGQGLGCAGQVINKKIKQKSRKNILLGYSLGGRIALHALKNNPKLWSAAIFLSTHLGLTSDVEREQRLNQDKIWAKKFLNDPWDQWTKEWDAQSVFCGHSVDRDNSHFSSSILARALLGWSLAKQEDFRDFLRTLNIPILWLIGENDRAALSLFDEVDLMHPLSKKTILRSAGHRLLWEAPDQVCEEITKFLEAVSAGEGSGKCTGIDMLESASHGQAKSNSANR